MVGDQSYNFQNCCKIAKVIWIVTKILHHIAFDLVSRAAFGLTILTFQAESFCGGSQGPVTLYFPNSKKSGSKHDLLELGNYGDIGPCDPRNETRFEKLVWQIQKTALGAKSNAIC